MICVCIGHDRHRMVRAATKAAAERADLVEVRLDYFNRDPNVSRLLEDRPCPIIATCRRKQDGGRFEGTEEKRLALLRQAIVGGVDYVDLEADIAKSIPRYGKTKRIVSYHDLERTPPGLEEQVREMARMDADIVKVATTAQSVSDNTRVLGLLKEAQTPTVAFCMGEAGVPSRVLGRKYGAPLTYAAMRPGRAVAPGQLTVDELLDGYNYKQINAETQVFGLIGNPIAHSVSPAVHNAAFRELGINAVYVPFKVDMFQPALADLAAFDVQGYSVTIPHKEEAALVIDPGEESVGQLKAANTIARREGQTVSYNTDWQAALEVLEEGMGGTRADGSSPLKQRQVVIVGAGGVARAVGAAVVNRGALLTIANRTEQRARRLAQDLDCRYTPIERLHLLIPDVLVNCTSVGMYPDIDATPFHPGILREGMLIFDTIYNPVETKLLQEARTRGCRAIGGMDMFIRQAELQFRLFTGQDAPVKVMRQAAEAKLAAMAREDEIV